VTSTYAQRAARLYDAAESAVNRLRAMPLSTVAPSFAPLGESLVWMIALDDLLKKHGSQASRYQARRDKDPKGDVLLGVRRARNLVVHGLEVVDIASQVRGSELGRWPLGTGALGVGTHIRWAMASSLPPATKYDVRTDPVYRRLMEGRPVAPTLTNALDFLRREAAVVP
jgi:hypothetical protein